MLTYRPKSINVARLLRVLVWCSLAVITVVNAESRFDIALINDGPNDRLYDRNDVYINELQALTQTEFDVRIHNYSGNWSHGSILKAIAEAYSDPEIDMLLVTGFVANQLASQRTAFPKPTFLPVLLDRRSLTAQPTDSRSGIRNLNYLSLYSDFGDDLDAMGEAVRFRKFALLIDVELLAVIPGLRSAAAEISSQRGIELVEVSHDGADHKLMNRVPSDVDAIFVAVLPRMPADDFALLVQDINNAGIPSFSYVGTDDVRRGLMMTSSGTRDIHHLARMNALNMQAVMLGGDAADQPVSSTTTKHFTINMATARKLGISLSFNVLNSSTLLHQRATASGRQYGLLEIAEEAVAQNQDLLAQRFATEAGFEEARIARAGLLPQLGLSATSDLRKVSPSVEARLFSERTSDGALSLQQLIYSDSASANVTIQKQLQLAREAALRETRLDIIQAATSAYYNVLNARSQLVVQENNLDVTRQNLQLAQTRVELGSSSSADVYRWQAEEARAQILVLDSRAVFKQTWNRLNRLLHRPQAVRIALREASFNEPFVISRKEFDSLVSSPADYELFSRFFISRGLEQAPELKQIDAQLVAKRRELTSQRRSYWLPDFSVGGRYTNNFSRSETSGTGLIAGQDQSDWTVGLQATLPLFSGGQRRAKVSRASLELHQLETQRLATAEKVEEAVRIQLHLAEAAYGKIALTEIAAESSRKNYDLVADAYARGTVSIIQLLDAQEASLSATAASTDSLYDFLTVIMALQRSVGGYGFMLPADQRSILAASMRNFLSSNKK